RVSSMPKPRAMALPTTAPIMPQMVASHSGLCCLPGITALAIRPSTDPTMMAHNQPLTASSYAVTRALPPVSARTRYAACRAVPYVLRRRPGGHHGRVTRSRRGDGAGVTWRCPGPVSPIGRGAVRDGEVRYGRMVECDAEAAWRPGVPDHRCPGGPP